MSDQCTADSNVRSKPTNQQEEKEVDTAADNEESMLTDKNADNKDDDAKNFGDDSDSDEDGFVDALDELVKNNEAANAERQANTKQTLRSEQKHGGSDTDRNGSDHELARSDQESDDEDKIRTDEQALKELEESMTDEQKLERKADAQKVKTEGNELFKCGEYSQAADSYTEALKLCLLCHQKERSIMFSNRAACKMHLDDKEGAIADCTKAVELNPNYLKALLRRAELYEKTEKLDEALEDYQKVVTLDPSQHSARQACLRLPDQIKERNEKLKDEMLGKLKDLGNLVLKPFGLSTDNFKLNQDPNTGGYSVSFQQGGTPK